jgi:hypothetical protein
MKTGLIACLGAPLILCLFGQARAHWSAQPDLPDWAQRGRLYWCLDYSTYSRPTVDLFLEAGHTLVQGGQFDSAKTMEYARQRGLHCMMYVESRTLTVQDIATHKQLGGAVLLKPDGSEWVAYNNPVRRYGSIFAPAWPEFVRDCTSHVMDKPYAAAIFYDNVYVKDDHNPLAIAAWKRWTAKHGVDGGRDMPLLDEPGPRGAAGRAFNAEMLVAYYAALRAFNRQHKPPLMIAPNLCCRPGYASAIIEGGAADLAFYETTSHPPFENNAYRYKLGLAASHGKPTGMVAYLPESVAAQRGTRTWHEAMHSFFYLASPLPEEFSLAAAEAAACGGTYITCYHLFPSLPITDRSNPFNQRIHRALRQSYLFLHAQEPLYASAQPGSDVAIFHSTTTQIQEPGAQNNEGLAKALIGAGIPFEVLVAADLTGDGTRGLHTLVVQNALYVDEPTAAGILRFADNGGRVVFSGGFARFDPLGKAASYASAKRLLDAIGVAAAQGAAPLGKGLVVFAPRPIESLPAKELLRLMLPTVHVSNPGKLLVNVLNCPAQLIEGIHLVNYDFRIRLVDRRPGEDPNNLAWNPSFERMNTPHSETELKIVPAEQIEVSVRAEPRLCLALSPTAPPTWLEGKRKGNTTVYRIPRVDIYTVLALAQSRTALEPLLRAQTAVAPWTIPPMTTPLSQSLGGLATLSGGLRTNRTNPHGGKQAIRRENDSAHQRSGAMQQFDFQQREPRPVIIGAWSRAENVTGEGPFFMRNQ